MFGKTGDNENTMLPKKVRISKDTRQEISVPLAMSTNTLKKNVQAFQKKNEKNNSWSDLGPRSA